MAEPATLPPPADEAQLEALVAKHRAEIDAILPLTVEEQRKAIENYGIAPAKLEKYYANLQTENSQLERQYKRAQGTATKIGWAAFLGVLTATILGRKAITENPFIQGIFVALASVLAGFAGNFIGWKAADGGQIQEKAKDLAYAARRALENELAIAMENTAVGQKIMDATAQPETSTPAERPRKPPTAPLGTYTESLAREKAQTVPIETTR